MATPTLEFPLWLRATHFLNFLFLTLLARSGMEILSAHTKLYWNDHCRPGSEWLTFSRKPYPKDELFTAEDQELDFPSLISLPGHKRWDLGRHWHFFSVTCWLLTGLTYVGLLFATGQWRRLLPTSWDIFPGAWHTLVDYLHLRLAEAPGGHNPLQQLTYAGIVFLVAPLSIATGAAMSPAIAGRFPWYIRIFGGKQAARSIHFLCLLAYVAFLIGHVAMVVLHGFRRESALIFLGQTADPDLGLALAAGLGAIALVVAAHVLATLISFTHPGLVQRGAELLVDPVRRALIGHLRSVQQYDRSDISPYLWVNGRPPVEEDYLALERDGFRDYVLEVGGLVERPQRLDLAQLRALPRHSQITLHHCIQGWSGVAEWTGLTLTTLMELCRPLPQAGCVVFHAFDEKSRSEPRPKAAGRYYGTIDMEMARHPQTLLAYDLNGRPLPREHGAPLRLRLETQYGFTMVKYIRAIEFVESYRQVGKGRGGWPEDNLHRSREASL
jgi:DMSO/TMAO reductase YedYZ molybdopterin-dependent catalytic subunit/thiosulfate reductase cytochrome b subunit